MSDDAVKRAFAEAEKEASELVEQARKARAVRLNAAKTEAKAEIKQYREAEDARLAKLQENNAGQEDLSQLAVKADEDIVAMQASVAANKSSAVELLMTAVQRVNLEVPLARKGVF
mmetsp:Transcript_28623/g.58508  ORF Transcript_28623/g.58508 Transcript_28623/m.58508 type:complete len:116 (+) Transcript_28623:32-379(+)|eukprot:CAMPEP_0181329228 /NCGR_PEP_ID=MMETSP1101-20121128/23189_1 /TAXON_ID=46948 /ORGANISM="Rhodomonas abbreviata, Strain Caron Lab Isolate" /LENGTH=115 /DNA_ID=CAMNT_0023438273 /DNA_START=32 /DNA_END=379 /DNA_ORIENTATION=-